MHSGRLDYGTSNLEITNIIDVSFVIYNMSKNCLVYFYNL